MKKIILLSLFPCLFTNSDAQINLEYTFPFVNTNYYYLSLVKFGYAGDKYLKVDPANNQIQIYSITQVLEKTIAIPTSIVGTSYNIYYVSDNLFDIDSAIEYFVYAFPQKTDYVFKEDSVMIFMRDSIGALSLTNPNGISEFSNIYPSISGTKLILNRINTGVEVYSLPGNLPCYECNTGVYSGNLADDYPNENRSSLSGPFPNPTDNLTRIDYQLPNGTRQADLIFFNTSGIEVKRFQVTNAFHFIYVSAGDLPSGTYYFSLQTSSGISDGKKMAVIR